MSRPYLDSQTGVWNGLTEVKTKTEILEINLYDDNGNSYPANLEIDVNDFQVKIINLFRSIRANFVKFNNPDDDIRDAIRNAGYKSQEIIYNHN